MSKQSTLVSEIRAILGEDRYKLHTPVVISNEEKVRWRIESVSAVNVQIVKYIRSSREDSATIDLDILEPPVLAEILKQLR